MKFTAVTFALLVAANAAPHDFDLDFIAPYGWAEDAKSALNTVTNTAKDLIKKIETITDEAINTAQTGANAGLKTADEGVRGVLKAFEEVLAEAEKKGIPVTGCLKDQVTITDRNLTFFREVQTCVDVTAGACKGYLKEGYDDINAILDTFTKFCTESTCSNWLSCTALTGELGIKQGWAITTCGGKVPIIAAKETAEVTKCMACVTGLVGGFVNEIIDIVSRMGSCVTGCITNGKCK